ncbi:hypothetical protein LRU95_002343 [Salmonella enterica]|nr:hypothetical protein [Salmonella enterica]
MDINHDPLLEVGGHADIFGDLNQGSLLLVTLHRLDSATQFFLNRVFLHLALFFLCLRGTATTKHIRHRAVNHRLLRVVVITTLTEVYRLRPFLHRIDEHLRQIFAHRRNHLTRLNFQRALGLDELLFCMREDVRSSICDIFIAVICFGGSFWHPLKNDTGTFTVRENRIEGRLSRRASCV